VALLLLQGVARVPLDTNCQLGGELGYVVMRRTKYNNRLSSSSISRSVITSLRKVASNINAVSLRCIPDFVPLWPSELSLFSVHTVSNVILSTCPLDSEEGAPDFVAT